MFLIRGSRYNGCDCGIDFNGIKRNGTRLSVRDNTAILTLCRVTKKQNFIFCK